MADQVDLTVTEIGLESRRVLRTVGIGFRPDDLAARNDTVWALDKEERLLARFGPEQTWDRFEHPDFTEVERIAVDDHGVWLTGGTRLIRVDPASGQVVSNVSMPAEVDGLAAAGDDVWAVSSTAASVLRIDPHTAEIRDRIPVVGDPGPQALTITADRNFIWVLNGDTATVVKIDPDLHDVVETYRLGVGRGSLALAAARELPGSATRSMGPSPESTGLRTRSPRSPSAPTPAPRTSPSQAGSCG